MIISELQQILNDFKDEKGDVEIGILCDDLFYDLDSEKIDIVEKEDGASLVSIDVTDIVYYAEETILEEEQENNEKDAI